MLSEKEIPFSIKASDLKRCLPNGILQNHHTKEDSIYSLNHSERLLRIKEPGEDSAVVAILGQETDFEGKDTLVIKETEGLKTVKYGEKFCVFAKEQVYDSPSAITYEFIIADESKPQEQKVQKFCTECGERLTKGDKFCRECGTPVFQ